MVTETAIRQALSSVNDPHIPVSIERMGMLHEVRVSDDGHVEIELGIPCLACPGVSMLKQSVIDAVSRVDGVTQTTVVESWHHDWDTDAIDPQAKQYMRRFGLQV
ncbi:metal-sulfur cluster assembly factor [Bradyrhizobium genosp. P]|uniref:metal-sulfur cluster assembly factor n=1 Tax=Bradyrhizobium genosp. P TaxID=83641 RepID=UPI003CED4C96